MKKIILIFVFALSVISLNSYSQNGWMIQNLPAELYSVNFSDNNTGYLLDVGFGLYKTTNCGTNWFYINTNLTYDVYTIFFTDNYTGYVCGDYARIFKTTNGGYSWTMTQVAGIQSIYLYSIKFVNAATGFSAGNKYILKTVDAGANWQIYQSPVGADLKSISFTDLNTGYAAGGNICFKTTNAGNNWNYYYFPGDVYINNIYFVNPNTGYGVGINCIVKSVNGGVNWTRQYPDSLYVLNSVYFTDINSGFAAGNNGVILRTTNGGNNWVRQRIELSEYLMSITFINNTTGFIAGFYSGRGIGKVLKTTNGGVWVTQISSAIPENFKLYQNYPNPFNPSTKIVFEIPSGEGWMRNADGVGLITLKVFDVSGREITTLVNEELRPGIYEVTYDGSNLTSGVYFYKIQAGNFTQTKRMVLLK